MPRKKPVAKRGAVKKQLVKGVVKPSPVFSHKQLLLAWLNRRVRRRSLVRDKSFHVERLSYDHHYEEAGK